MKFPCEPLFTIERSNRPEITVSGIICIIDSENNILFSTGDIDFPIWSRSCLKPWQLLGHYQLLKETYPALQPKHFAIMQASHNGEAIHIEAVREILKIGSLDESYLQCPSRFSNHPETRCRQKIEGLKPQAIYSGCSGKHSGFLLAVKKMGGDLRDYLNPKAPHFNNLKEILRILTNRQSNQFDTTIDGCRLPNYALEIRELARLYCNLINPKQSSTNELAEISNLMLTYPLLIGGTDCLDTRLILGQLTDNPKLKIVAKEGADGLLAVGIGACKQYPTGLGIFIKLASGYNKEHSEIIIKEILKQLNLKEAVDKIDEHNQHIKTKIHFKIGEYN